MIKVCKKVAKKVLGKFGYELRRPLENAVDFEVFANLVQAYERRLKECNVLLPESGLRSKLLARLSGTPPSEAYFLIEALFRTREIDGDVCEFGVAEGETSALIANEITSSVKMLHLFDSFEGLPRPTAKDRLKDDLFNLGSMESYTGTMAFSEDFVRARLQAVKFLSERFVIHKGFFEDLLEKDVHLPRRVSFAYVDFDFYEPIKTVLGFLDRVMPPGAIAIVDDYDFFSTGAKTAVDEFIAEQNDRRERYGIFVPDVAYGHFAILTKKS